MLRSRKAIVQVRIPDGPSQQHRLMKAQRNIRILWTPQQDICGIYCGNKSFRPLTQKLDSKAVTPCRGRPAGPKPLPKQDMNIYHPRLNQALFHSLVYFTVIVCPHL